MTPRRSFLHGLRLKDPYRTTSYFPAYRTKSIADRSVAFMPAIGLRNSDSVRCRQTQSPYLYGPLRPCSSSGVVDYPKNKKSLPPNAAGFRVFRITLYRASTLRYVRRFRRERAPYKEKGSRPRTSVRWYKAPHCTAYRDIRRRLRSRISW